MASAQSIHTAASLRKSQWVSYHVYVSLLLENKTSWIYVSCVEQKRLESVTRDM